MNVMIKTKRFAEFIEKIVKIINEENTDKFEWDFYLHRIYDKSYSEFLDAIQVKNPEEQTQNVKETVFASFDILNGFNPTE